MDLFKAFGIYKEDQSYPPIPESRGLFRHDLDPHYRDEWVDNVTPHEAVDLAVQQNGGFYTADDGHEVMFDLPIHPQYGEPGLRVIHRRHGKRANDHYDYRPDTSGSRFGHAKGLRNRESKANEWIQHFAEHPGITQIDPLWQERMDMYDL